MYIYTNRVHELVLLVVHVPDEEQAELLSINLCVCIVLLFFVFVSFLCCYCVLLCVVLLK